MIRRIIHTKIDGVDCVDLPSNRDLQIEKISKTLGAKIKQGKNPPRRGQKGKQTSKEWEYKRNT